MKNTLGQTIDPKKASITGLAIAFLQNRIKYQTIVEILDNNQTRIDQVLDKVYELETRLELQKAS